MLRGSCPGWQAPSAQVAGTRGNPRTNSVIPATGRILVLAVPGLLRVGAAHPCAHDWYPGTIGLAAWRPEGAAPPASATRMAEQQRPPGRRCSATLTGWCPARRRSPGSLRGKAWRRRPAVAWRATRRCCRPEEVEPVPNPSMTTSRPGCGPSDGRRVLCLDRPHDQHDGGADQQDAQDHVDREQWAGEHADRLAAGRHSPVEVVGGAEHKRDDQHRQRAEAGHAECDWLPSGSSASRESPRWESTCATVIARMHYCRARACGFPRYHACRAQVRPLSVSRPAMPHGHHEDRCRKRPRRAAFPRMEAAVDSNIRDGARGATIRYMWEDAQF
jgi:hypothetical protein